MFIFLACSATLAFIPLFFIRHVSVDHPAPLNVDDKKEKDLEMVEVQPEPAKVGIIDEIKAVTRCALTPRMLLLWCFFFNDGYQQVFMTSQFNRQIVNLSSIGTIMGVYSIVDVVSSYIHGWLSDRYGHLCVVTLATVCEVIGIIVSWFANQQQNWLNYATGILMAISDAGYQTEVLFVSSYEI